MIGIFGGTFDPVHLGHLRTALDVKYALQLQQVRFIPCSTPPHRSQPIANADHRAAMLQLALQGEPNFILDIREIDRGGPSYMLDTLQSLHQDFRSESLYLILGMDAFRGFDAWHRYLDILSYAHIVVMYRPGTAIEELRHHPKVYTLIEQHRVHQVTDLHERHHGLIWLQPVTQLDISATAIRAMCQRGEDVRYLVPDAVRDYIQRHRLYAD